VPSAARVAALTLALACAAGLAHAQVLYKWIDEDGKVQYRDTPPKNPKGPVTRIEPDVPPAKAAPAVAPKAPVADAPAKAEAPPDDIVTKRRAKRAELEERLKAARARLDAAKKELADSQTPDPDERMVIQQELKAGQGGMHGLSTARSNCRPVQKDGKQVTICPAMLATDAYYERIAKLELAVRDAEVEVEDAERAWRRGVD